MWLFNVCGQNYNKSNSLSRTQILNCVLLCVLLDAHQGGWAISCERINLNLYSMMKLSGLLGLYLERRRSSVSGNWLLFDVVSVVKKIYANIMINVVMDHKLMTFSNLNICYRCGNLMQ